MAAATKHRNTSRRNGDLVGDPVAAATTIYAGVMVALDAAGNAINATPAAPIMRGVSRAGADNSAGVAGAMTVEVMRGDAFLFAQTGLDRTDIGSDVFVVDNQTVGATGTLIAGTLIDIDDGGAWVEIQ